MKKLKLLAALMALLICTSVFLVSCNNTEEAPEPKKFSVADIMNPAWVNDDVNSIASYKEVAYSGDFETAQSNFLVTTDTSAENRVTRVYNASTDGVLLTLTDSRVTETSEEESTETIVFTKYHVDLISSKYFAVLSLRYENSLGVYAHNSQYFGCPIVSFDRAEYGITIYDENGAEVNTFKHSEIASLCGNDIYRFDSVYAEGENAIIYEYKDYYNFIDENLLEKGMDVFKIGNKLYRFKVVNNKLDVTLIKDYGISKMPNITSMSRVGDYYLEEYRDVYTVYDNSFKELYKYSAPGYSETEMAYLLAGGKLLVQYVVQLDQNATEYDVREGADGKYSFTTLIVDAEGAKDISEESNYIVRDLEPSVSNLSGKKLYADSVDNLAYIYPIGENKMPDYSAENRKLVVMSNDGLVVGEVDVKSPTQGYPEFISEGYISVEHSNGTLAIYAMSGELVSELITDNFRFISDDYILRTEGIYDMSGALVYDLVKNHATVENCGDTVIIKTYGINSISYGIFVDGEVKTIGTVAEKDGTIDSFYKQSSYYCVYDEESAKYSYYNDNGALIGSFDKRLNELLSGDGFIILQDTENKIYYKFS